MTVRINGRPETIPGEIPVTELLLLKGVKMPELVSVQLNGEILPRESFPTTTVGESDEVEFLYFMGGGA